MYLISYIDIDGDGRKEMFVQKPTGAHGSDLRLFVWQKGKYRQCGHLGVGTPVGFEFGDFNGDGQIEIMTEEVDWSSGSPYTHAPRLRLLFRWNGKEFVQLSRTPIK